jgi:peptidoglycan/LPS O-acetylase OafA/YrhL
MALWHAPSAATKARILKLVTIQYLRGFAASLIVLDHASAHPMLAGLYDLSFAQVGVDVFFVVSGVIMWITTASRTFDTPSPFWRARIVRIVPLYWLATAAYVASAVLIPSQVFQGQLSAWHVICSLLFIPAQSPAGLTVPVYSLGWTLNYEMFFYLLFGVCLLARRRSVRLIAVSSLMLGLVCAGLLIRPHNVVAVTYTDPIMLEFLGGVWIGALFLRLRGHTAPAWTGPLTFTAAVVLFAILLPSGTPRAISSGVPALLSIAAALLWESGGARRDHHLGRLLGDASYSIYLAHPFVLRPFFMVASAAVAAPAPGMQLVLVAIAAAIGIFGGVICYRLVERPMTSWLSPRWRSSALVVP